MYTFTTTQMYARVQASVNMCIVNAWYIVAICFLDKEQAFSLGEDTDDSLTLPYHIYDIYCLSFRVF